MLDLARESATIAGLDDAEWTEGDVENVPVRDDGFYVVLSNFGHVFAPDSPAARRELHRVTAPGGQFAFTP